jgi:two-component system, OmpR family, alkaline phosphatase synthesis response regulator PhoP
MENTIKSVILLIEDSATIRTFYKKVLESSGFEVIEAETGEQGWIAASERIPHLICLDMILPDIHGLEVLKKIRSNTVTKTIPVLVLTTLKDFGDVQKAINLGANYYAIKGSDSPEKLLGMIDKLLKRIPARGAPPA